MMFLSVTLILGFLHLLILYFIPSNSGAVLQWLCGMPISFYILVRIDVSTNFYYMTMLKPQTISDAIKCLRALKILHVNCTVSKSSTEVHRKKAVEFSGYALTHLTQCSLPQCPISAIFKSGNLDIFNLQNYDTKKKLISDMIIYNLNIWISEFEKNATTLKLILIAFLFTNKEKLKKASLEIETLQVNFSSLPIKEKIILRREMLYNERILKSDDACAEFKYIEYCNSSQQFVDILRDATQKYVEFWMHLKERKPKHHKIEGIGNELIELKRRQKLIWKSIRKSKYISDEIIQQYCNYLERIEDDIEKKKKVMLILKEYDNKEIGDLSLYEICSRNSKGVIQIYAQLPDIGSIVNCNNTLLQLFGYDKESLVGNHIDLIVPDAYREHHAAHINKIYEKEPKYFKGKILKVFGKHSTGYIFPICISIQKYVSLNDDAYFIGMIDKGIEHPSSAHAYVLVDNDLKIINVSMRAPYMLSLSIKYIKSNNVHIYDMCSFIAKSRISSLLTDSKDIEYLFPMHTKEDVLNYNVYGCRYIKKGNKPTKKAKETFKVSAEEITFSELGRTGYSIELSKKYKEAKEKKVDNYHPFTQWEYQEEKGVFLRKRIEYAPEKSKVVDIDKGMTESEEIYDKGTYIYLIYALLRKMVGTKVEEEEYMNSTLTKLEEKEFPFEIATKRIDDKKGRKFIEEQSTIRISEDAIVVEKVMCDKGKKSEKLKALSLMEMSKTSIKSISKNPKFMKGDIRCETAYLLIMFCIIIAIAVTYFFLSFKYFHDETLVTVTYINMKAQKISYYSTLYDTGQWLEMFDKGIVANASVSPLLNLSSIEYFYWRTVDVIHSIYDYKMQNPVSFYTMSATPIKFIHYSTNDTKLFEETINLDQQNYIMLCTYFSTMIGNTGKWYSAKNNYIPSMLKAWIIDLLALTQV